ncbi:hypothetical protein [Haloferula sp. BvORR071]|uniref:hypothetical protein n=1 Tax=Haloferula sp. BvORR071 TaxID=1396141 RepID=UPI00054F8F46|nr:hypothetical protein [Haloferula sp. BvORR071]
MRYREVAPLTRVAGLLWTACSLFAVGLGAWIIWTGFPDPKQTYVGLVFAVMGSLSTAFGLALAFEREPRRKWLAHPNRGLPTSAAAIVFFLGFFTAGLFALGGMMVPGVFHWSAGGVVLSLGVIAVGAYPLWAIFKKRRKQRERSLKTAQEVAEARERRLRPKGKRP